MVCGLSVSASADYNDDNDNDDFNKKRTNAIKSYRKKEQWTSDPRMVRVRKCTATTSPQIDRVRTCTVITGIQSPARNTHVNEQSQSPQFYVK